MRGDTGLFRGALFYLDRLGRGLPYLIQVVADLEQKGVGFKSLTE